MFDTENIGTASTRRTGKMLKAQLLLSALLFWYGPVLFFISGQFNFRTMLIGGAWYVVTKVLIWWRHK